MVNAAAAADVRFAVVPLLFVADHDGGPSAEGEAIFKRSLDCLSPPNCAAEPRRALREEVRSAHAV